MKLRLKQGVTRLAENSTNFKIGELIAARYEVVSQLGSGGMGEVYKVIDRELNDQLLALKVLHKSLASDEQTFKRFRNEVFIARGLVHRNIVRIFDLGKAPEGYFYISMEYVDGAALKDLADSDQLGTIQRSLPSAAAQLEGAGRFHKFLALFEQLLEGVGYAHRAGVIHRDLKPANIFVTSDEIIKLLDFGTARLTENNLGLTMTGQVIGTPLYMSPEQIRGEDVDARCDVYSLGLIGYEIMTGQKPFVADTAMAAMFHQLQVELPRFASDKDGIPEWYEQVIRRASAKNRDERFANGEEMLTELRRARDGGHTQSVAKQKATAAGDESYVKQIAPALISVALCAAGVVWYFEQSTPSKPAEKHGDKHSPTRPDKAIEIPTAAPAPIESPPPIAQETPEVMKPTATPRATLSAVPSSTPSAIPAATPFPAPSATAAAKTEAVVSPPTEAPTAAPVSPEISLSMRDPTSTEPADSFSEAAAGTLRWLAVLDGIGAGDSKQVLSEIRVSIVDARSGDVVTQLPAALIALGLPGKNELRIGGSLRSVPGLKLKPGVYKLSVELQGLNASETFTVK